MKINKLFVGIVIIVVIILFKMKNKSYDPIFFENEMYTYVESTTNNKVSNHFFTPDGVDVNDSNEVIQITDASHPELSQRHVDTVKKQILRTMNLKPYKGSKHRYFGMFRTRHPIYAVKRDRVFILYYITSGFNSDKLERRINAGDVLDSMEEIEVLLLK
ncbi:MAG: hypothetical protein COB38_04550 [Gammaproteobacteria bacterium]|nr:MAG: hypothetical protein COB38_04550 [Gammaproteobacteria bacterium]